MVHRRDAELAEVFNKEIFSLRTLRLCGELQLKALATLVHFSHSYLTHPTGFHSVFSDIFRHAARPGLQPGGPLLWLPVFSPVSIIHGPDC